MVRTLSPIHLATPLTSAALHHLLYYIIITIVRSYTGKYHEFLAVCIVMSAQHE